MRGVDARAPPLQDRCGHLHAYLLVELAVTRQIRTVAGAEVGCAQPGGDAVERGAGVREYAQVQRARDAEIAWVDVDLD